MKQVILVLTACAFFSCRQSHSNYPDLIKGDWVGAVGYLCFEDSMGAWPLEHLFHYRIEGDLLFIENIPDSRSINTMTAPKYRIKKLTADSLQIQPIISPDILGSIFSYSRIHPKNNITPSKIYFVATGVRESSYHYLTIDSSRNVLFYGIRNTSLRGGYRGKLSIRDYEVILNKIRALPLNTMDSSYAAPQADGEAQGIYMITGDSAIHFAAFNHYKEPMELHLLFKRLLRSYLDAQLQPDTTVNEAVFEINKTKALSPFVLAPEMPEFVKEPHFIVPKAVND